MPTWNAEQYLRFSEERTQPCRDLVARIVLPSPRRVMDLGCGPGNSTAVLAQRWPAADLTGLDSSAEMIAKARATAPGQAWVQGDIEKWQSAKKYEVVFSNAALQWLPHHAELFPRLLKQVAAGGVLAVQMPANYDAPAHSLMRALAATQPWKNLLPNNIRQWHVHDLGFYYDVLSGHTTELDMWTTEYLHILAGPEEIVAWYKGSGLRPYLDALSSANDRRRFLADYQEAVTQTYPRQSTGAILFPFRRMFLVARR